MYVILGGTGHVGAATAGALLDAGEAVTVVTRDTAKAEPLRARGAEVAVADLLDHDALVAALRRGRRLYMVNPPAAPSTATEVEEQRTAHAIVGALAEADLEWIVVASTYGAQPGRRCGDLNVLYDLEQAVMRQPVPATMLRAAYYMSNWATLLDASRGGTLPTPYPADFALPMVAPADIGTVAARLLRDSGPAGIHHVEGPERYTPDDVARAFADALGRPVEVATVPRDG